MCTWFGEHGHAQALGWTIRMWLNRYRCPICFLRTVWLLRGGREREGERERVRESETERERERERDRERDRQRV